VAGVAVLFPRTIDLFGSTDTLDRSWLWALYRSWRHQTFGRDVVFTYGPYGFLEYPALGVSRGLWAVAALVGAAGAVALALGVVHLARRSALWPAWSRARRTVAAVLAGGAVLGITHLGFDVTLCALGVVGILLSISFDPAGRWSPVTLGTFGVFGALGAQVKVSDVPFFVVLLLAALIVELSKGSSPLGRRTGVLATSLVGSVLAVTAALWLAAGDAPSAYPTYLARAYQLFSGYDAGLARRGSAFVDLVGLALAVLVVFAAAGVLARSRRADPRARVRDVVVVVVVASFAFLSWKEGFVRQDAPIAHQAYGLDGLLFALVVLAVLVPGRHARDVGLWASTAALAVTVALVPNFAAPLVELRGAVHAASFTETGTSPSRAQQVVERSLAALRVTYRLPAAWRERIGGRGVVIVPWNLTIGPAYALHEVDLPVPQLYAASTTTLDQIDAAFLRRRHVPFVILSLADLDGRYSLWSAPATDDVLLTDYAVVASSPTYALLAWDPLTVSNRFLSRTTGTLNAPVRTPACPGGTLTARLFLSLSPRGRVADLLYQVLPPHVRFTTTSGVVGPFRLVWSNTADGVLLSSFVTSTSALPRVGRPDTVNPAITSFTVLDGGDLSTHFDVTFTCHVAT